MTKEQFIIFDSFRNELKSYCSELCAEYGGLLKPLQKEASKKDTPDYPLETPVVYNTALDELTEESEIRLIVIGDNPGKDEQLFKNQKYLVGQSGKIAAGFFAKNPEFCTDFRKNAIILNKTPLHTAKTGHIKYLVKNGGEEVKRLVSESQLFMAKKTAQLHIDLIRAAGAEGIKPELWLVGYAELRGKGLFLEYRDSLKALYRCENEWDKVFVFQHFSMNRFSIDLKKYMDENKGMGIVDSCRNLGTSHRVEIFGK